MISSIVETDYTAPSLRTLRPPLSDDGGGGAPIDGYWYYTRYQAGESHPRYCRAPLRKADGDAPEDLYPPGPLLPDWDASRSSPVLPGEETVLDVEELADGTPYLAVGAVAVSPDQRHVAYSYDPRGDEVCEARVREMATGRERTLLEGKRRGDGSDEGTATPDEECDGETRPLRCDGSLAWDDSGGIFWAELDGSHRPHKLYHRRVFDGVGDWIEDQSDELLFEEDDGLYELRMSKTFDGRYLLVTSESKEASEVRYVDLRPGGADGGEKGLKARMRIIAPRRPGVLYRVSHCLGHWLVSTNLGAGGTGSPNLGLVSCRVGDDGGDITGGWDPLTLAGSGEAAFDGGHGRSLDVREEMIMILVSSSCDDNFSFSNSFCHPKTRG